MIHAV
jgi:hypothetical protein